MSLKTRLKRLEKRHRPDGWEAPFFIVMTEEDLPRVDAEMDRWREEIERDRARGRTTFGVNFLPPDEADATDNRTHGR